MTVSEIVSRLKAKKSGSGWIAKCPEPGHADKNPSLSVSIGPDGRTLVHCHAGCTTEAICAAIGIKLSDLFAANGHKSSPAQIVATYSYHDAAGKMLFEVVRYEPKTFRQRRPDKAALDGWTWNTKCVSKVLFRLPEILRDVKRDRPIFLTEGEKDVLAMVKKGFSATCNPGGAGKWQDSYTETLRGADSIPNYLLYMPSGVHVITPSQGGRPVTVAVEVDAQTRQSNLN